MYEVNFDISGQVAVITGAGGIICGVMAKEMAKKGVKVALLDLFVENAQKIADEINAAGGEAVAVKANVLDRESLEQARQAVLDRFGRVDILINGAGGNKKEATVSPELDFFHLNVDAFKWVFDLNVTGAVLTTMVFGELLAKQGTGNVINIASMATYLGTNGHIAIRTNHIGAAVAELAKRGYTVDEETAKYKGEKMIAVYLHKEFGGFAVHLLQK